MCNLRDIERISIKFIKRFERNNHAEKRNGCRDEKRERLNENGDNGNDED